MNDNKEFEEYHEKIVNQSINKFVDDIESIFLGFGKKEVRKVGLTNLIKTILKKGEKNADKKRDNKLFRDKEEFYSFLLGFGVGLAILIIYLLWRVF